MEISELCTRVGVNDQLVVTWMEYGWLLPVRQGEACDFSEVDLARACLIRDLQHDLGANDEAIPIILDLIDQIHGLRRIVTELRRQIST